MGAEDLSRIKSPPSGPGQGRVKSSPNEKFKNLDTGGHIEDELLVSLSIPNAFKTSLLFYAARRGNVYSFLNSFSPTENIEHWNLGKYGLVS